MPRHTYVTIRVFTWDQEADAPFGPTPGNTINEHTYGFKNAANATSVFEDCAKPLERAIQTGMHEKADRAKPGPKPVTPAPRVLDLKKDRKHK